MDWKCGVTNAILTVLVYLLLLKLLPNSGKLLSASDNWYESLEVLLLVGSLVAFNVNSMVFSSCVSVGAAKQALMDKIKSDQAKLEQAKSA
jgi:hypothetical protein